MTFRPAILPPFILQLMPCIPPPNLPHLPPTHGSVSHPAFRSCGIHARPACGVARMATPPELILRTRGDSSDAAMLLSRSMLFPHLLLFLF
ncbi:MAG: hypothetical protein Q8P67_07090 [archaeon]|nr:hypothetical protein [archaeon]